MTDRVMRVLVPGLQGPAVNVATAPLTKNGASASRPLTDHLSDYINVKDFAAAAGHALGTGEHEDDEAFQDALDFGERIYVPPPAEYYAIGRPLVLPSNGTGPELGARASLVGADRNTAVLKATAAMDALLKTAAGQWNRGRGFEGITLDANSLAARAFHQTSGSGGNVIGRDSRLINARECNMLVEEGENQFSGLWLTNDNQVVAAGDVPQHNLLNRGADNHYINMVGWNASRSNFKFDLGSGNSRINLSHAYNFPQGGAYQGDYNFEIDDFVSMMQCAAGGGANIGIAVTGFGAAIIGNFLFDLDVGIWLKDNLANAVITGNTFDDQQITIDNCIMLEGVLDPSTRVWANPRADIQWLGPLLNGVGQTTGLNILGALGSYLSITGRGSFGIGDGISDLGRRGVIVEGSGNNGYIGDAQRRRTVLRARTFDGATRNMSAAGNMANATAVPINAANIMSLRGSYPTLQRVRIELVATSSGPNYATWEIEFTIARNGAGNTVVWLDASGNDNAPTWTKKSGTTNSSSWIPGIVKDTVNGGWYPTVNGLGPGSTPVIWAGTADVTEAVIGS